MFFSILFVTLVCLAWVAMACRVRIREHLYDRRTARVGEQEWFEVIQESSRRAGPYSSSAFDGVRTLTQFLNGFSATTHRSRPRVTFAWMKSSTDDERLTRLYVGLNANAGDAGKSALRAYAKSIGARLKPVPEVHFPSDNLVTVSRNKATPSQVKDMVEEVGLASEAVAQVAESTGVLNTSAVLITLDGMGKAERGMLNEAVMTEVVKDAGHSHIFASGSAQSVRAMSDNAVRMSITAVNNGGSEQTSKALAGAVIASTSTLGYNVDVDEPKKQHILRTFLAGVPIATILVLMLLFGAAPAAIIGFILMAAGSAALLMWDEVFLSPLERAAARGISLMPDFVPRPLSVRRGLRGVWLRSTTKSGEAEGQQSSQINPTAYPSGSDVLSAHPGVLFEMLTLPASATLTASDRLQSRGLPSNMVSVEEGIFMGMSGTGQPVFLDLEDIHYTLYTAGAPNSGKSNLLLVLFAGMVKTSIQHTSGLSVSPIWGETKGEGAYDAWMIARHHPGALFVDVHNPHGGARLALEGKRLSEGESVPNVLANCTRLVSSLQAAYGDGIKSAAREIFDNVLRCAMLMTAEDIKFAGLDALPTINPHKPNIMELSFYLLLGDTRVDPSQRMISLGASLSRSSDIRSQELSQAIGSMSRFWDAKERRTYAERISTVLNKINDMRRAPMLWNPDNIRQDIYVGRLVQSFAPSVVNMGSYYDPEVRQFNQSIDRSVSQRLIRSFNYLLWDYIKGRCNGWQAERKRIPMFFDEVADVAVDAESDDVPNTIEEGTKEGRSRGAAYYLGSQYPSQMPDMVRHQVLASRGKLWFGLQNSSDLTLAVTDLMVDDQDAEGAITPGNIKSLTNGVCFATIPRHNSVSPPFLLRVPYEREWRKILFAEGNMSTDDAVVEYTELMGAKEAAGQ